MFMSNGRKFKVDALVNGVIYEFYGDYWHGNPNKYNKDDVNKSNNFTFGELHTRTIQREKYLEDLGYKIVSVWESEFKNKYNYDR